MKGLLQLLLFLSLLVRCGDLPPDEEGAADQVTLSVFLEPGDSLDQKIYLTHPVSFQVNPDAESTFVPGAEILLVSTLRGDTIQAREEEEEFCYRFSREEFPLVPYDRITLILSGVWDGKSFRGSAATTIVNPAGFTWLDPPPADTVMIHDESLENPPAGLTAFYLRWSNLEDSLDYGYQLRFAAVVRDEAAGDWRETPRERLCWLREMEEEAFQMGPYPILRSVPAEYVNLPVPVSWGAFVFVDCNDDTLINGVMHHQGWYEVRVERQNRDAMAFYFSIHQWIRQFDYDLPEFNLEGRYCRGIVASRALLPFRVRIVSGR